MMITNHPVHIYTEDGEKSQSAFIPFCGYGGNFSALGSVKYKDLNSPFCNSFRPSFVKDQLCYEVDVKEYLDKDTISKDLSSGLIFLMDYNEDRELMTSNSTVSSKTNLKATIIIDGLGKNYIQIFISQSYLY